MEINLAVSQNILPTHNVYAKTLRRNSKHNSSAAGKKSIDEKIYAINDFVGGGSGVHKQYSSQTLVSTQIDFVFVKNAKGARTKHRKK